MANRKVIRYDDLSDTPPYKFNVSDPLCPWCWEHFANWSLAKRHVKHCPSAPLSRAGAHAQNIRRMYK